MTATANVVLEIGSKLGPGGFASLQSAISMVGQLYGVIVRSVAQLDDYAEKMSLVDMSMINYADSMSAAQVGSLNLMSAMGRLNVAGVKVTKEQFAAMSVAANDYSDRIGGTAADAMDNLTSAMIRGSERGLKPFGIEIDKANDKIDGTTQALNQVTERFGDVKVKTDNFSEAMLGAKNNIGDFFGAIWSGVQESQGPFVDMILAISDAIGGLGEKLSELNGIQKSYIYGLQLSMDGFRELRYEVREYLGILTDLEKENRKLMQGNTLAVLTGGKFGAYDNTSGDAIAKAAQKSAQAAMLQRPEPKRSSGASKKKPNQFEMEIGGAEIVDPFENQVFIYQDEASAVEFLNANLATNLELQQEAMDLHGQYWEIVNTTESDYQQQLEDEGYAQLELIKQKEEAIRLEYEYANSIEGRAEAAAKAAETMDNSWKSIRSSIDMVSQAYEKGTKDMTAAQAALYYVDCVIGAVVEGAKAAAAFAKPFGSGSVEGALHVVAAAAYIAAAAVAAAHGGSHGASSSQAGASRPSGTGAGAYSGGYDRGSANDSLKIYISFDKSAAGFSLVTEMNDRSARAGSVSFQRAA